MLTFEQFHKFYILNELLGFNFHEPFELVYNSEFSDTDINEKDVGVSQRLGELTVCGFKLTRNNREVNTPVNTREPVSQIIMKSGKKSYENPDKPTYKYIPIINNKEQVMSDLIDRFASVRVKYPVVVSGKIEYREDFIFNRLYAVIPLPSSSNFSTAIAHEMVGRIFENDKKLHSNNLRYGVAVGVLKKLTVGELRNINNDDELRKYIFKAGVNFNSESAISIFNDVKKILNNPHISDTEQISSKRIAGHPYKSSSLKHPLKYDESSKFIPRIIDAYKYMLNEILEDQYKNWWDKDLSHNDKIYLKDFYFKANKNNGLDIALCDDDKVTGKTQVQAQRVLDGIKQEINNMFSKIDFNPADNDNRYQMRLHKFYSFCVNA